MAVDGQSQQVATRPFTVIYSQTDPRGRRLPRERAFLRNSSHPTVHTYGYSVDEALANAEEAIELYVEELRASGEPIPADVEAPMVASVEVAA